MESGGQIWRRPPLVSAVHELRWFGRTWSVLAVIGKPREQVLDDLAGGAGLVGAGWTIVCAAAAFRIAARFSRWEVGRGRVVLCRPLSSGRLAYVYYVDVADAAPEES